MSTGKHLRTAVVIFALSAVAVSPALAQGNGKGRGNGNDRDRREQVQRERPTLQRRGTLQEELRRADRRDAGDNARDNDRDRRNADRRTAERRRDASWEDIIFGREDRRERRRDVPPGWCKGRGNPHNTPENCGYSSDRRYDWDYGDRYGGYGSYSRAHTAFHRALDREYAARASQRRNDPLYHISLRAQKAADHERWHDRTGTRH